MVEIRQKVEEVGTEYESRGRTYEKKSDSSNKWIALNEDVPSRQASEISSDKLSKLD